MLLKTAALGLSCPSVRALSLYGAEPDPLLKVNNDSLQLVCRAGAGEWAGGKSHRDLCSRERKSLRGKMRLEMNLAERILNRGCKPLPLPDH